MANDKGCIVLEKYFFIYLLLFTATANAKIARHIEDPHHILQKLDLFEERNNFEEVFHCPMSLLYERHQCAKLCEPFQCFEVCNPNLSKEDLSVTDCKNDSASISSNGKVLFILIKKDFGRMSHFRAFVNAPRTGSFELPGQTIGKNRIRLDSAKEETFTLANGKKLPAIRISFTYFHWDEMVNQYIPSKQSLVYGKANQTAGLFLEHRFDGLKDPVSKVIQIN